jgi:hypothetical protein
VKNHSYQEGAERTMAIRATNPGLGYLRDMDWSRPIADSVGRFVEMGLLVAGLQAEDRHIRGRDFGGPRDFSGRATS